MAATKKKAPTKVVDDDDLDDDDEEEEDEETPVQASAPAVSGPSEPQESEPVHDPVDEYPERPLSEAMGDMMTVQHHTEEGRYDTLQVEQDPETGELRKIAGVDGPVQHSDYVEEVVFGPDGQKVGYIAPKYD